MFRGIPTLVRSIRATMWCEEAAMPARTLDVSVIALPDTRRYRSLTEQRATSLAGARAEVWFVDPAGSVEAR